MFLTTIEKLNATPEAMDRYIDVLTEELSFARRIRAKLEPITHVEVLSLRKTSTVKDLLRLLTSTVEGVERLTDAKTLLDRIRKGEEPVVQLRLPLNHYTFKKHPLAEAFTITPATVD